MSSFATFKDTRSRASTSGGAYPVPQPRPGTWPGTGIRRIALAAGLLLLASALLAACGDGDAGLTRAEVEEIVRAEMAGLPDEAQSVSNDETADMPAQQGLTRAEVEEIVRAAIASVPSKATPAEYTQYVVDNAVARYETQGLDATVAHYNSPQSVDGQWYVFIIDEHDQFIAHPDPGRLGLDLNGWVGTDANGHEFGPAMLAATEDGAWVSYVYRNPESGGIESGDFELKNVWVERHDGLLFASGWYIDADAFTEQLVSVAVDKYRDIGLTGTMTYFASPGERPGRAGCGHRLLQRRRDHRRPLVRLHRRPGREDRGALRHLEDRRGHPGPVRWGAGPCPRGRGMGGVGVAAGVRGGVRRLPVRLRVEPREVGRVAATHRAVRAAPKRKRGRTDGRSGKAHH